MPALKKKVVPKKRKTRETWFEIAARLVKATKASRIVVFYDDEPGPGLQISSKTPPLRLIETPAQTFEKLTGMKWPGGASDNIVTLLRLAKIDEVPGTTAANIALQKWLQCIAERITLV